MNSILSSAPSSDVGVAVLHPERPVDGKSSYVKSDFIPQYEFPGVSAVIKGLDPYFFSMISLSMKNRKDDIIGKLNVLADSYEKWIKEHLIDDPKMADKAFAMKSETLLSMIAIRHCPEYGRNSPCFRERTGS